MIGYGADEAFVCTRGRRYSALQQLSSDRSFAGMVLTGTETVPSLQPSQTQQTRDEAAVDLDGVNGSFAGLHYRTFFSKDALAFPNAASTISFIMLKVSFDGFKTATQLIQP